MHSVFPFYFDEHIYLSAGRKVIFYFEEWALALTALVFFQRRDTKYQVTSALMATGMPMARPVR
jgi:hypothetical protein